MLSATAPERDDMRYEFGKNWCDFVQHGFTETAVERAREHIAAFLRLESLRGLTFLDIGCGSGLHSLAAYQLGAERIVSFDYDSNSVAATERLWRYVGAPGNWTVQQGSVLDAQFLCQLPSADVVYSWGVLHHTGDMWQAIRNAAIPMKSDGVLYISLYSADNCVDPPPEFWIEIKRAYNRAGTVGRRAMEWWYFCRFYMLPAIRARQNPIRLVRDTRGRGMSFWIDVRDWLGGYPMEFASLSDTTSFAEQRLGLDFANVEAGQACTEFLFCRLDRNAHWRNIAAQRKLTPLSPPFPREKGFCYLAPLPERLRATADIPEHPSRSTLMLYEDGRPLGLRHTIHDIISLHAGGRFSHFKDKLYFSSTDGSDPNTNGRAYSYCANF